MKKTDCPPAEFLRGRFHRVPFTGTHGLTGAFSALLGGKVFGRCSTAFAAEFLGCFVFGFHRLVPVQMLSNFIVYISHELFANCLISQLFISVFVDDAVQFFFEFYVHRLGICEPKFNGVGNRTGYLVPLFSIVEAFAIEQFEG